MSKRREFLKGAALQLGVLASSTALEAQIAPNAAQGGAVPQFTPPQQQPPAEQKFTQYQLGGKPDPQANLLGGDRPTDWAAAKTKLIDELSRAAAISDPIHEWVKVFLQSFDERATAIVIQAGASVNRQSAPTQLKYEPQLYEASLSSSSILLDRCLKYRNEIGGYEVSGVSSALAYLTFLKLKPLQRNFLMVSNSADVSEIESQTEKFVANAYRSQGGIDRLLDRRELQAKTAEASGAAAEADLTKEKQELLTTLLEKQFNIQSDAQLAQFTRMLTPGTSSNFAERYLRLVVLLAEDLTDAFCKLYSASKGIRQVLNLKTVSITPKQPIESAIPLFKSADDVAKWVAAIVPSSGTSQRKPDILDALVLWSRAVVRDLAQRSQYETEVNIAVPLTQPWGKTNTLHLQQADIANAFGGANPTGSVTFKLVSDSLSVASTATDLRITGIGLSVEVSADMASPVQYTTNFPHTPTNPPTPAGQPPPPSQEPTQPQIDFVQKFELKRVARLAAVVSTPFQINEDATTYSRPKVVLTNVRLLGGSSGDSDPVMSMDAPCRGLNPRGQWTVTFDPNVIAFYQSAAAITDSWVTGLVLHLRVRMTYA